MAGFTGKWMLIVFFLSCRSPDKTESVSATENPMTKLAAATTQAITDTHRYNRVLSHNIQESRANVDDGPSNYSPVAEENLNKVVDELLDNLRKVIPKNLDTMNIPRLEKTFTKNVMGVELSGDFKAEKGWLKSLSSIRRKTDVIVSSLGDDLTLSCGVGFGHLEVGYDKYKATFMGVGPEGKLNGLIDKNSLFLKATVAWKNNTCIANLNDLSLAEFGEFKLETTGLGSFNWLFSKVSSWLAEHFKNKVKGLLESKVRDLISKELLKFDCTEILGV